TLNVPVAPELQGQDLTPLTDSLRFDFNDTIPGANPQFTSVSVSGEITGPGGLAAPAPQISTSANPNDTLTLADFRLTGLDQDGDPANRTIVVTAYAEINPDGAAGEFVDNQAFIDLSTVDGVLTLPSHDPALPDDGSVLTGDPTRVDLYVDPECDDTPGDDTPGGDDGICLQLEEGEIECDEALPGALLYKMPVTEDMEGETIEIVSLTPGVTIAPGAQFVAPGTTELLWSILGATPGTTVKLLVNNVEVIASDPDGYALCCSTVIEIEIPEEFPCLDKSPDLSLEKKADTSVCDPEGPCDFTITVKNVGDAPYTGPVVIDEWQIGDIANLLSWGPAGWNCGPNGGQYECTFPGANIPVGGTLDLNVSFQPGAAWPEGHIRNCARINWGIGNPVIGDPSDDKDCAQICIKGKDPLCTPVDTPKPNLEIQKLPDQSTCVAGEDCGFTIRVTNISGVDYAGPVVVKDEVTVGTVDNATFEPAAEWNCLIQTPTTFQCTNTTLGLGAGDSRELKVKIKTPADYDGETLENCGTLIWNPGEGDANPADDGPSCARVDIIIPQKPNLEIQKQADQTSCLAGEECGFTIRTTNTSGVDYTGPVVVKDEVVVGTVDNATFEPAAEWNCVGLTPTTYQCTNTTLGLGAGDSRELNVKITTPADYTGGILENCGTLIWEGAGDADPADDGPSCDRVQIIPQDPGQPEYDLDKQCKTAPTSGESSCRISIRNIGDAVGPDVSIADVAKLLGGAGGVTLDSVAPDGPQWSCSALPAASLSCDIAGSEIVPGGPARYFDVVVSPNTRGRFENCAYVSHFDGNPIVLAPNSQLRACDVGESNAVQQPPVTPQPPVKPPLVCPRGTVKRGDRCVRVPQCSPGQRLQNGQCVNICRQGTRYNPQTRRCVPVRPPVVCEPGQRPLRGKCVNICAQGTRYNPQTRRCDPIVVCRQGQRLVRGQCVNICRQGTRYNPRTRRCDPIVVCKPGQRIVRGQCVNICRQGTRYNPRTRRCDPIVVCKPGQRVVRGQCVNICRQGTRYNPQTRRCVPVRPPVQCRVGQRVVNGKCVNICRQGTRYNPQTRRCVPVRPPVQCRTGQRVVNGKCVNICRQGTRYNPQTRRCVSVVRPPVVCKRGQRLVRGKCVTITQNCPRGTVRRGSRCVKIQAPVVQCKRGQRLVRGKCVTVNQVPINRLPLNRSQTLN
ncbi:MAG: hypothetical protein ABJO38_27215, partial [Stappiaceae bacterium]